MRTARLLLALLPLVSSCDRARRDAPTAVAIDRLRLVGTMHLDDGTMSGAALTPDGRILVMARPNILAVFDTSGVPLATLGRTGGGPGEFRMLFGAVPGGSDSVWAFDFQQRRTQLFSVRTGFLDGWRIEGVTTPNLVGRLRSGELLLVSPFMPMPAQRSGLSVDTVTILALSPPAVSPTPLLRIPWSTRFQSGTSPALISQPLGPSAHIVAADSTFFVAFGDRAEIQEFSGAGALVGHRVLDLPSRAVTDAEVAWVRTQAERPSTFDAAPDLFRDVPLPATAPIIGALRFDGARLWVGTFAVSDTVPTTWYAFSALGVRTDSITLPSGTRLLDIRGELVVARVSAPSGDEWIAVYRLDPATP